MAAGGSDGFFDFPTRELDRNEKELEILPEGLDEIPVEGADQLVDRDELNDETFADDLEEWVGPEESTIKSDRERALEEDLAAMKLHDIQPGQQRESRQLEQQGELQQMRPAPSQHSHYMEGTMPLLSPADLQNVPSPASARHSDAVGLPLPVPASILTPPPIGYVGRPILPPPHMHPFQPLMSPQLQFPSYSPPMLAHGPARPELPRFNATDVEMRMRQDELARRMQQAREGALPLHGLPNTWGYSRPDPRESLPTPYPAQRSNMPWPGLSPMQGARPAILQRPIETNCRGAQQGPRGNFECLMTDADKDFIVRVQLAQLQTNNPMVDDYYFQTYNQRKVNKQKGLPRLLPGRGVHSRKYHPEVFENTLGKLQGSSIHAPKPLISGSVSAVEHTGAKSGRRTLLLAIENSYSLCIMIDRLAGRISTMPASEREEGKAQLRVNVDHLFASLHVTVPGTSPAVYNDTHFLRLLMVNKGQQLLAHAVTYFTSDQCLAVSLAVMRNLTAIEQIASDAKEGRESIYSQLQPMLIRVMSGFGPSQVCAVVQWYEAKPITDILALLKTSMGTSLFYTLWERYSDLAMEVDGATLGDECTTAMTKISAAVLEEAPALLRDREPMKDDKLWGLLELMTATQSDTARENVIGQLRPLAEGFPDSAGARSYLRAVK